MKYNNRRMKCYRKYATKRKYERALKELMLSHGLACDAYNAKINQLEQSVKDNYNKGYTDGYTASIDTIKLAGIKPIDNENKTMGINDAINCIVDYCKKHRKQNYCDGDKCSMYNYCFNYGIEDWGYVKEINGEIKE